jgi:hypothetical protein
MDGDALERPTNFRGNFLENSTSSLCPNFS